MSFVVQDLLCRRSGQALFEPVSFEVAPGTAAMLRGPNGIGKTTLLRGLSGLGEAPDGSAMLFGTPVRDAEGDVAYSGHLDAIKPSLTVAENLGFWAQLHGQDPKAAMDHFDLNGLRDRPAGRLSAGQKRRLGLARLMVNPARLWLMDEPTVSLDAENTERLAGLVRQHLGRGGIAVLATHVDIPLGETQTLTLGPAKTAQAAADPFLEGAFGG